MSSADLADPELLDVAWDLGPLLDGDPSDPVAAVDAMLAEAQERADRFAERYAGRVAELDGAGLAEAMHELADLQELVARAGSFSGLHFSTDTADPARGALYQRVQEKATPIETKLLFFELEWAALAPGLRTRAFVFNTLLADKMVEDRLRGYPHWLASRNLANEASDESVQALVTAVRNRYEVPRRR